MPKAKRRAAPKASQNRRKTGKRNPGTKVIVIGPKQNKGARNHRRRSNPSFFGSSVTPIQMAQYVGAGIIGLTVNRVALPMLPDFARSSNIAVSVSAVVLAAAEWWAASLIDKGFGSAVGFGALMGAGSVILNQVVPTVGSRVPISGYRRNGMGDFVPGSFTVPQVPVDTSVVGQGAAQRSAYPSAYAMAA